MNFIMIRSAELLNSWHTVGDCANVYCALYKTRRIVTHYIFSITHSHTYAHHIVCCFCTGWILKLENIYKSEGVIYFATSYSLAWTKSFIIITSCPPTSLTLSSLTYLWWLQSQEPQVFQEMFYYSLYFSKKQYNPQHLQVYDIFLQKNSNKNKQNKKMWPLQNSKSPPSILENLFNHFLYNLLGYFHIPTTLVEDLEVDFGGCVYTVFHGVSLLVGKGSAGKIYSMLQDPQQLLVPRHPPSLGLVFLLLPQVAGSHQSLQPGWLPPTFITTILDTTLQYGLPFRTSLNLKGFKSWVWSLTLWQSSAMILPIAHTSERLSRTLPCQISGAA